MGFYLPIYHCTVAIPGSHAKKKKLVNPTIAIEEKNALIH